MNILSDLYTALSTLDIPIETGVFKDEAPERYIVIVPMVESFDLHADNAPGVGITTDHIIVCDGSRYDIVSVEDVKGRGMYIEVLAKRSEPTSGKG